MFGAITSKPKEEAEKELRPELQGQGRIYQSPIVRLRQGLNLRPCKAYPGNPLNYREDIDIVAFRENTEDLYAGVEFHPVPQPVMDVLKSNHKNMKRFAALPLNDVAISLRIFTRQGARNIIKDAFDYAQKFGYKSVTIVEKPNVIRETSGLMIRVARDYPYIQLWETNIDAKCMWLIKNPHDYGVLVTSNIFGDIISALYAQLVCGLGFASSGNIGDNYAVFEPIHGSAPKYVGKNKFNPMAMFLTCRLMLEWLGEKDKADRLEQAIARVIAEGQARAYDMGGDSSTTDMAFAVAKKL